MTERFRVLVLGGTSWLGGAVASLAVERGHRVTCLARGDSGTVPVGASHVRSDRWAPGAYDEVADRDWDAVVDVSWQPELVRSALDALAHRTRHWVYVSSISVYADHATPDADESAPVVDPWSGSGEVGLEAYGGAKVSCETSCRTALDSERLLVARGGLIVGYGDRSDRFGYWPAGPGRSRGRRGGDSGGPAGRRGPGDRCRGPGHVACGLRGAADRRDPRRRRAVPHLCRSRRHLRCSHGYPPGPRRPG